MSRVAEATIDEALERFLARQRERLSERTYRCYEEVIWLLRQCLDGYAYSSLSDAEQRRWRHAFDAGDEQAYCRLLPLSGSLSISAASLAGSWCAR